MRLLIVTGAMLAISCSFPDVTYSDSCESDSDCSNDPCRAPCEHGTCNWDKVTCTDTQDDAEP